MILVSFEDITALEVGQMRRDFVANVSHELRTPLTALMGFIETLRGAARDDAAARDRFLETMERGGRADEPAGARPAVAVAGRGRGADAPETRVDLAEIAVAVCR